MKQPTQLTQLALTLLLLALLPCPHADDTPCPPVTSVFDLPDIHLCRDALRTLLQRQPCPPKPRASPCCQPALAFTAARCQCWPTFDREAVAKIQAIVLDCPPQQQQQQQQQQAEEGAGGAQGGDAVQQAQRVQPQEWVGEGGAAITGGGGGSSATASSGGGGRGSLAGAFRVFVGVLSSSANREARDAIRAGWGRHPALYRVRFFVGRSPNTTVFDEVRREAAAQRDVVVLPLVTEHYHNITYQTLEICRFAAADPEVTHVLKVDDDSYVRVDRLVAHMRQLPRERLLWGNIEDPGGSPHRNPESQWYVSEEEWVSDRYPPWAHGAGYVLSADLALEIAAGAALKPLGGRLFKLEDVSMGSWLEWIEQEGGKPLSRVKDARFNFAGCSGRDLVSHYIGPQQQRCIWQAGGRGCRCHPRAGFSKGRPSTQLLPPDDDGTERAGIRRAAAAAAAATAATST